MPVTPSQRQALLRAEQTHDRTQIVVAVTALLVSDPKLSLLDVELILRDAGCTTYLVQTNGSFDVYLSMPAMLAKLKSLGRTPAENRIALAL